MPDPRHVNLSPAWLKANSSRLAAGGSLTVLIVDHPEDLRAERRWRAIAGACEEVSNESDERLVVVRAHSLPPGGLERTVIRSHLAVVILSNDDGVTRPLRLLDEEQVPRLILITPDSAAAMQAKGACGEHSALFSAGSLGEARARTRAYLLEQIASPDRLRARTPVLMHNGVDATRKRALSVWESCETDVQVMIAAWSSRLPEEVATLLCSPTVGQEDQRLLAQIDNDLRSIGRQTRWTPTSDVLTAAELDAFGRFCRRQRLAQSSSDARLLLSFGESRARDRRQRLAQGAEARDSLSKDTSWARLWTEM